MADLTGYTTKLLDPLAGVPSVNMGNVYPAKLGTALTYYYQMECTDAATNAITTWVVQGTPDFGASTPQALAAIAAASLTTPVRNVRIVTRWPVS